MLRALAVLAVVIAPRIAAACSGPVCEVRLNPQPGEVIPANAPAIALGPRTIAYGAVGLHPEDGGVELLAPDGSSLPFTVTADPLSDQYLLHATFTAGEAYTVRFAPPCDPAEPVDAGFPVRPSTAPAVDGGYLLQIGPAAPLPATLGSVTVLKAVEVTEAWTACGSCTRPIPAGVARLQLQPSAELAPFLAVTRVVSVVDGTRWAWTDYGAVQPDGGVSPVRFPRFRSPFELFTNCAPDLLGSDDDGLTAGSHTVVLQAEIAGLGTIAELSLPVVLGCTGWESLQVPPACGWWMPDGGGAVPADGGDVTAPQPRDTGCGGWFASLGALAVALAFRRVRA